MTCPKEYDLVVPLHLIPVTIAQRIRERGGNLYRISIVRTHQHHYTIKCKCRAKIAMEPLEDSTDRSPAPGPASSGSSGALPEPGHLTEPFSRNPVAKQKSRSSHRDRTPGLLTKESSMSGISKDCADRTISRALELIADFSRRNPEPGLLSGEPGTGVTTIDQTDSSRGHESELIAESGKDPGQLTVTCPSGGTGLPSGQSARVEIVSDQMDRSVSPGSESGTSSSERNPGPVITGSLCGNILPCPLSGQFGTAGNND